MKDISLYDIYYSIDMENLTFSGRQIIHGETEGDLWLNASGMDISSITLNGKPMKFTVDPDEQTVSLDEKYEGHFELGIEFSGKLSESLSGVYYSREKSGFFVSSQFAPTGARMAFPCVDNPNFKSKFRLTLDIPGDYEGISNMPPTSTEVQAKRKIIRFYETPPMSTYLLYIGAGKFDIMERRYADKPLYLISSRDNIPQSELPLTMASDSLKFFEQYFGIDYALPKLHLIAVPDFALGAMENWGAITFREIWLMISKDTSLSTMKRVDIIISHELSHQWFGDLVTMKWWDDIWLNESFATFMSYKVLDSKHPEWKIIGDMVTDQTGGAMQGDSLRNTHPIHVDVRNPEEIEQIFDEISYGKGASVLRMLEGYVGEEAFRKGVSQYLKDHKFSNAEGHNLWESIEKTSDKPVSKIMETWVTQPGYPLIQVSRKRNTLKLTQTRFFLDGSSDDTVWPIPLNVKYSNKTEKYLMKGSIMEIPLKDFQYINPQQTGFYRLKYDEETWNIVSERMRNMDANARWGVLSDSYALFLAGHIDLKQLILNLKLFEHDNTFIVRDEITAIITRLHTVLNNSKQIDDFAIQYLRDQLDDLQDFIEGEPINITVIRERIQTALSIIDITYASKLADSFEVLLNFKPEDRLAIAIGFARTSGNFERMKRMYLTTTVDEDRIKLLTAMGHITGDEMIKQGFDFIFSTDVKKQDFFAFIGAALTEHMNRPFLCKNIHRIFKTLDNIFSGTGATSRYIENVISLAGLYDEEVIKNYLANNKKTSWDTGIRKGFEYLNIYQNVNRR